VLRVVTRYLLTLIFEVSPTLARMFTAVIFAPISLILLHFIPCFYEQIILYTFDDLWRFLSFSNNFQLFFYYIEMLEVTSHFLNVTSPTVTLTVCPDVAVGGGRRRLVGPAIDINRSPPTSLRRSACVALDLVTSGIDVFLMTLVLRCAGPALAACRCTKAAWYLCLLPLNSA